MQEVLQSVTDLPKVVGNSEHRPGSPCKLSLLLLQDISAAAEDWFECCPVPFASQHELFLSRIECLALSDGDGVTAPACLVALFVVTSCMTSRLPSFAN